MVYAMQREPGETLEDIYRRFNIDHPEDFKGCTISAYGPSTAISISHQLLSGSLGFLSGAFGSACAAYEKEYGISAYSIYQLDLSDNTDNLRFMSLDWLETPPGSSMAGAGGCFPSGGRGCFPATISPASR